MTQTRSRVRTQTPKAPKVTTPIMVEGIRYYPTPTGIKVGSRGKVLPAGEVFGGPARAHSRELRKALRAAGRGDLSGAPTVVPTQPPAVRKIPVYGFEDRGGKTVIVKRGEAPVPVWHRQVSQMGGMGQVGQVGRTDEPCPLSRLADDGCPHHD